LCLTRVVFPEPDSTDYPSYSLIPLKGDRQVALPVSLVPEEYRL
jgi:hypothetical protein